MNRLILGISVFETLNKNKNKNINVNIPKVMNARELPENILSGC